MIGVYKQNDTATIRWLLPKITTGTPKITIIKDSDNSVIVNAATMTVDGANNKLYTYDWAVGSNADDMYHVYATSEGDTDNILDTGDNIQISSNLEYSSGIYTVTIHSKDTVSSTDLENVFIEIHNSSNDDEPILAYGVTDSNGNLIRNLNAGTYYLRGFLNNYIFTNQQLVVSASATVNFDGVAQLLLVPTKANMCRVYFYAVDMGWGNITNLQVRIEPSSDLNIISDTFIINDREMFKLDTSVLPYRYYFDMPYGMVVKLLGLKVGIDEHILTVPSQTSYDLKNETFS
jgi:hypothetical protein